MMMVLLTKLVELVPSFIKLRQSGNLIIKP